MNEAKLWQLRAGLITESEYQASMKETNGSIEQEPVVGDAEEKSAVTNSATLKLYLKDISTGKIKLDLDPKEAVELYNFINQFVEKGSKASISGIARTTNANFTRTVKNVKA